MYKTRTLKFIAWDLDGTLANTHAPNYLLEDAELIKENADLLKKYYQDGYTIFIWSSRHWDDYKDVETWLKKHEIPFQGIWLGKPLVKEFWDDRAYNPNCKECKKHYE